VFDDADLDKALDAAMAAKFRNIGQACTAANRFLVHRALAQPFTERLAERVRRLRLGHGTAPGTQIGPLISRRACRDVHDLVTDAVARGAALVTGGEEVAGPGNFYRPTVLADVPPDSAIAQEEIFGPVVAVTEFDTEEEAIRLANHTPYGLASYVFTENLGRAVRLVDALDAGMMGVNIGVLSNAAAPFGGIKQSGLGREGGPEGIGEYLAQKYTLIGG
jgi:succinate-semialdehyde dehydrogenase/glutarate-semialdehyde dehydrogenase